MNDEQHEYILPEPVETPDGHVVRSLDFSEFHPLDHWPWESRCREFYGGPRRHVSMSWEYRVRPVVRAKTLCRLGRHQWGEAAKRAPNGEGWVRWEMCGCCLRDR